ncbi:hypothetical protein V2J09_017668 [Rumex salicifolius]
MTRYRNSFHFANLWSLYHKKR